MKVLTAECYGSEKDIFEVKISENLKTHGSELPGAKHATMLEDSFDHEGPNGRHMCLIFKVMGESMSTFKESFPNAQVPSPLVQRFATQLLQAIQCAHTCDIIHTDVQPGNIMLRNPDESALTAYLESKYADAPRTSDFEEQYNVVPSRSLRGRCLVETQGFNLMNLGVSLGDWGVACWKNEHLSEIIQPQLLRTPEVSPRAPWGPAGDIWNLGALLPELIFGQNKFSGQDSGGFTIKGNLTEMNALLRPFPHTLMSQAKLDGKEDMFDSDGNVRKYRLSKVVPLKKHFAE